MEKQGELWYDKRQKAMELFLCNLTGAALRTIGEIGIWRTNKMRIIEVTGRNSSLIEQLLGVWESSVKATHLFLSESEIEDIKKYVPQALKEIPHLIIAENENQVPVGFMGIVEQHLEMLFISHEERGKGLGKKLLKYGIEKYMINDLAVNEQNPLPKVSMNIWGSKFTKELQMMNREIPILFYI